MQVAAKKPGFRGTHRPLPVLSSFGVVMTIYIQFENLETRTLCDFDTNSRVLSFHPFNLGTYIIWKTLKRSQIDQSIIQANFRPLLIYVENPPNKNIQNIHTYIYIYCNYTVYIFCACFRHLTPPCSCSPFNHPKRTTSQQKPRSQICGRLEPFPMRWAQHPTPRSVVEALWG